MMRDIVYILKYGMVPSELVYSLRSVAANFPYNKIWFVGSRPEGLKPDIMLEHEQKGMNKWERIRSSMLEVIKQPELTEEFYLFNDDFFVMEPFAGDFINFVDRDLKDRIQDFYDENNYNAYLKTLEQARAELLSRKCTTHNFEVHLPMLMEKSKVREAIMHCHSPQMRSIYGNVTGCPFVEHKDVKVYRLDTVPDNMDFVSTNDKTFAFGKIGEYIRERFDTPSRYEVTG